MIIAWPRKAQLACKPAGHKSEVTPRDDISLVNDSYLAGWPGGNTQSRGRHSPGSESAMPENIQIQCINKSDRPNPHERILKVGGIHNGKRWSLTQEDAIEGIEAKKWNFFVHVGGKSVWVIVAISRFGNKYLKTESDGENPNNLLSLPECP